MKVNDYDQQQYMMQILQSNYSFLFYELLFQVFLRNYFRMKKQIVNLFHKTFSEIDRGAFSVAQLEKNILHTSKERRRFNDKMEDRLPIVTKNASDFKIISPFYDRNKVCKALNCQCPYHKRIKEEAVKKYQIRTRKNFNSTMQSPSKNHNNNGKEIHPRLSHKLLFKDKYNNSLGMHDHEAKFSNRNKINSYNIQFDEFLKQTNQLLLDRKMFGKINDHKIKSSVVEIFQYIYTHLDRERKEVADYIQNIEKDRDLTNFYLERYDDLKKRKTEIQRNFKPKPTISKQSHHDNQSPNNSRSVTRHLERKTTTHPRKTNKSTTQKLLIIEKLIKVVKQGAQIDEDEINDVAELDISTFEENCSYLKKKIANFDYETLEGIKEQIVEKLKKNLCKKLNKESQLDINKKKQIVTELLGMLDKRLANLQDEQNDKQYEREQYDRISSSYSKLSGSRKGSCDFQGKKRSSKFNDLAKKTIFFQQNNQNNEDQDQQEDQQISELRVTNRQNGQGLHNSPRTSHNKANTAFVSQDDDSLPQSLKKNQSKLKLAKYRRLSHDGFFYKHNNSGDESSLFIPKIKIQNIEDIAYGLDTMALQFGEKWKKIKEIQRRISDMKMKKYIINQEDSLITAKRKVRMLRNLLKQDVFQGTVKEEIKQYVTLIEQFNLLKNRNWAERKLKNMINIKSDDIEMVNSNLNQQSLEDFIKKHILEIFGRKNKLIYYDVLVTQYQEKQINLQNHLFQIIEKDLKLQNGKYMKFQKKLTKAQNNKSQEKQKKIREDELIQKGLQDHYQSRFCYQQSINILKCKTESSVNDSINDAKANDILSHFKYFERMRLS